MARQARGTNRPFAWLDCERSASVRPCARAQPMSARQNAKPSEQTARDLKFQNLRAFRCRDLPLCGSRFCRRKCGAAPKLYAASRAFRAFTAARGAFYHATFEACFLARLRRAAQARTYFASNGRVSSFSSEAACALNSRAVLSPPLSRPAL